MRTTQVIDFISNWLAEYLDNSGLNGFVIGVSGGIDSAVTSTLAARTGKPTLVLEMPIHQKEDQVTRAQDHINWLKQNFSNVEGLRVDLTSTFDNFCETVSPDASKKNTLLSLANTRSRIRMSTLYYYGGLHGYLVTGTGNKVEDFGVGFFTKYGDGGVDISPIADLFKSEVYKVASELGIIDSIQKAKPTDGLWDDDRTDEDQMGASYDELEWAMQVIDKGAVPTDFEGRQKQVLEIYHKLHRATLHKITPIPVCEIPKELK